jgi:hypothetical protein
MYLGNSVFFPLQVLDVSESFGEVILLHSIVSNNAFGLSVICILLYW